MEAGWLPGPTPHPARSRHHPTLKEVPRCPQSGTRVLRLGGGSSCALIERLLAQHQRKDRTGCEHLHRTEKCGTLHARALGSKPLWLDKPQLPHVGLGVRSCSLLAMAQGALGVRGVMQRGMT